MLSLRIYSWIDRFEVIFKVGAIEYPFDFAQCNLIRARPDFGHVSDRLVINVIVNLKVKNTLSLKAIYKNYYCSAINSVSIIVTQT